MTARRDFERVIASLNYDGQDTDSLTVGEIRRALPREKPMSDLISRAALLTLLRKEREDFFNRFAPQDGQPDRKFKMDFSEILDELDQRLSLIEAFPAVEPVAKLVNNNQANRFDWIETIDPRKTIDVGTPIYVAP